MILTSKQGAGIVVFVCSYQVVFYSQTGNICLLSAPAPGLRYDKRATVGPREVAGSVLYPGPALIVISSVLREV